MSGSRFLLAALALALVATLWLLASPGARNSEPGAPVSETGEEAAPAQMLTAPVTSPEEAPRRAEEPRSPAVAAPALTSEKSAGTVELLVTDTDKKPLAGARILVTVAYENEVVGDVTTGADGRARIERPEQPGCFVAVERAGYVPMKDRFELGKDLTLELLRAVRLTGRVLDATSRTPLAGAHVTYLYERGRFAESEEFVSDADGRYELTKVPAGLDIEEVPNFVVRMSGYPTLALRLDTSAAPEELEHDFLLTRGRTVSGRVLEFPGRTPLERACIQTDGQVFWTDALGHFEGPVSEGPGELLLQVRAQEHNTMLVHVARDRMDTPSEILLPLACALEGTVRDRDGAPVLEAWINAGLLLNDELATREGLDATALGLPSDHRFCVSQEGSRAKTDAEGRYRLGGLLPMPDQTVSASAKGFRPMSTTVEGPLLVGGTARLDLVLDALGCTGTVRGRLTLNGEPARFTVHWKGPTREGYAWTNGDRYELREVECGAVQLDARFEGRGSSRHKFDAPQVQVAAGTVTEHDFELSLAKGRITGHVRYESGQPAAGIQLTIQGASSIEEQTETDAEGAYACEVPEQEKPYLVLVLFAGDLQRRFDARPGGPSIDFVLPELASLRFRVQDAASGAELAESSLAWRRPGETNFRDVSRWVPPDAEGWRTVTVPRGPLELLVRADAQGYLPRLVTDVQAGEPQGATILLERGASHSFRLAPGAEPFPDDHVLLLLESETAAGLRLNPRDCLRVFDPSGLYPFDSLQYRRLRFGADGGASLAGLAPGVHRFRVCPEDLWIEPAEVTVGAEAGEAIQIRWGRR